jgi:putative transposase
MRKMGIEALYRKPNTSKRHAVFPYRLRGLAIEQANPVWAMDITYLPMARGFVYLAAVLDWHSRRVLAQRVSITMEADFYLEALAEAIGALQRHDIGISRDGRGQWGDDVLVERVCESVKYGEVYLKPYDSVRATRAGIGASLGYYNSRRLHRAYGGPTPDVVYFGSLPQLRASA